MSAEMTDGHLDRRKPPTLGTFVVFVFATRAKSDTTGLFQILLKKQQRVKQKQKKNYAAKQEKKKRQRKISWK